MTNRCFYNSETTEMNNKHPFILASASPRRRRLLGDVGLEFTVIPADIEERRIPSESPVELSRRLAEQKARCVADRQKTTPPAWVIGADTIVVLDNDVLGKPTDQAAAEAMLRRLSGRTHRVITGWAVGQSGSSWVVDHCSTEVTFHPLTERQIADYAATKEGMDKAGAYAIQGIGSFLVDRIDGNYYNVVGLPISHVIRTLIEVGALESFPLR